MKRLLTLGLLFYTLITFSQPPFTLRLEAERTVLAEAVSEGRDSTLMITGMVYEDDPSEKEASGIENKVEGLRKGDLFLMELGPNGDPSWVKSYGDPETLDKGLDVTKTRDGGYLVVGYTLRHHSVGHLARTDRELWDRDLAALLYHKAPGIRAYVVKTGPRGERQWAKTYGLGTVSYMGYRVEPYGKEGYRIEVDAKERSSINLDPSSLAKAEPSLMSSGKAFVIDEEGHTLRWMNALSDPSEKDASGARRGPIASVTLADGTRVGVGSIRFEHDRYIFSWSRDPSEATPEVRLIKEANTPSPAPLFEISPIEGDAALFRKTESMSSSLNGSMEMIGVLDEEGRTRWCKGYRVKEQDGEDMDGAITGFRSTPSGTILFYGQLSFSSAEELQKGNGVLLRMSPDGTVKNSIVAGTEADEQPVDLLVHKGTTYLLFRTQVNKWRDEKGMRGSILQSVRTSEKGGRYRRSIDWEETNVETLNEALKEMEKAEKKKLRSELKKVEQKIEERTLKRKPPAFETIADPIETYARFSNVLPLCTP